LNNKRKYLPIFILLLFFQLGVLFAEERTNPENSYIFLKLGMEVFEENIFAYPAFEWVFNIDDHHYIGFGGMGEFVIGMYGEYKYFFDKPTNGAYFEAGAGVYLLWLMETGVFIRTGVGFAAEVTPYESAFIMGINLSYSYGNEIDFESNRKKYLQHIVPSIYLGMMW
jgi:hypothetical protein